MPLKTVVQPRDLLVLGLGPRTSLALEPPLLPYGDSLANMIHYFLKLYMPQLKRGSESTDADNTQIGVVSNTEAQVGCSQQV